MKNTAVLLVPALLVACAEEPLPLADFVWEDVSIPYVPGPGAVVSQEPRATLAGVHLLHQGGNAVDAAVATAFALTVVEPTNSGLGGRTQILIRTADGEVVGIDGTNQVPAGYPADTVVGADLTSGYGMIGIPGTVAALTAAHERYGSLSLEAVMRPAVLLARQGFALSEVQAGAIARVSDQLRLYEGSTEYFLGPDGAPYEAGDHMVQGDLARTLQQVAEGGRNAFYRGEIAHRIVADMEAKGGYVTLDDLEGYTVRDALVSRTSYRGHEVLGTYLPAGGANVQAMLRTLELATPQGLGDGLPWAAVVAQSLATGFQDRLVDLAAMGPPESFPDPERLAWLLDERRLAERARSVRIPATNLAAESVPPVPGEFPDGYTTHVSVVDPNGMAVSLTQSLGPTLGSRVAAPGLGFAYSATMGYLSGTARSSGIRALGPGDRASSRQSPSIVVGPDGELAMVIGGSGSRRILSAVVQVISRVVDQGLSPAEAMAAPRLHVEPHEPDVLYVEGEWPTDLQGQLGAFGYEIRNRLNESVANISAVFVDPSAGVVVGIADPRGSGAPGR